MLDFLENLYKTVKTYKSSANYVSIFKEISNYHYRENYHSDILALYLRFKEVKSEFIKWLNKRLLANNKAINYDEYDEGFVEREEGRIDILLYSSDRKKAIIIENKSNNAKDQDKQLFRYYNELQDKNVIVEAIFYLNKRSLKEPDYSGLDENAIKELKELIIVGQLVEEDSFTENVIKTVIQNTNNIRLNALSQEIMDLLNSVIYGDINMENLESFAKELAKGDNLEKLQCVIKAYYDTPEYIIKKYLAYANSKNTGYRIEPYHKTTLVINIITKTGINYVIDVGFSMNNISFELWVRNKGDEKRAKELLIKLKDAAGEDFPFKNPITDRGYKLNIENVFDDVSIEKMFDDIFELGKKYMV